MTFFTTDVSLPEEMPEQLNYLEPEEQDQRTITQRIFNTKRPQEDQKKANERTQRMTNIKIGIRSIVTRNMPDEQEPIIPTLIRELEQFQEIYNITDRWIYDAVIDDQLIPEHVRTQIADCYKNKLGKKFGYTQKKQEQVWLHRSIMHLENFKITDLEKKDDDGFIEVPLDDKQKEQDKTSSNFFKDLYKLAVKLQFKLSREQQRSLAKICNLYIQLCNSKPAKITDEGYLKQQRLKKDIKDECKKLFKLRSNPKSCSIYCAKTALMLVSLAFIALFIAALIVSFGGSSIVSAIIGATAASAISSVVGTTGATAVATIGTLAGGGALTVAAITEIATGVATSLALIAGAVVGFTSLAFSWFAGQQPAKDFVRAIRGSDRMSDGNEGIFKY